MPPTDAPAAVQDSAAIGAGLDVLDTPRVAARSRGRRILAAAIPTFVALVLLLVVWQILGAAAFWPEYKLPAPSAVWHEFVEVAAEGRISSVVWTSVHRALVRFAVSVVVATPLGLAVAKVPALRAGIGPLLAGMQSLPSVAWVPAAVLWFGLTDSTI